MNYSWAGEVLCRNTVSGQEYPTSLEILYRSSISALVQYSWANALFLGWRIIPWLVQEYRARTGIHDQHRNTLLVQYFCAGAVFLG